MAGAGAGDAGAGDAAAADAVSADATAGGAGDERTVLPLACTLGPDDGPARLRRWQRLHDTADPDVRVLDGVLEVSYRPDPGVRAELDSLAAAERGCCAFVAWSVSESGGRPVLRVAAPPGQPEVLTPVTALFGL